MSPIIRESTPGDRAFLETLYPKAFPGEGLLPLVKNLLGEESGVISLVAEVDSNSVGHIMFTRCGVTGNPGDAALLGPLAVAPDRQRQGLGTSLVRSGLDRMEKAGVCRVFVLGDPDFYGRFGFSPEREVAPPYSLPPEWREAWQSKRIGEGGRRLRGTLEVPPVWQDRDLWLP